jgi:hypothetical protein
MSITRRISINVAGMVLLFFPSYAAACDIDGPSFRQEFRRASDVFVGQLVQITDTPKGSNLSGKKPAVAFVTFRVEDRWKGAKNNEIVLTTDLISMGCDGAPMRQFERDHTYLIFSKKGYTHFREARLVANANAEIKKLDDVWFRTWARILPF